MIVHSELEFMSRTPYKKRITLKLRHYKMRKGCDVCGYNKHGVSLDFAHIDPSEKSIHMWKDRKRGSGMGDLVNRVTKYGTLLNRERWKELKDEIRKCRVVCKNCHYIETYEKREVEGGHLLSNKRRGIKKEIVGSLEGFL